MANINDYKIVEARSKKYSKFLNLTTEQFDRNGARFGFYLLVLECVTNEKEVNELSNMIIDTDFRSILYDDKNDDLGIDAVFYKYREKSCTIV